MMMNIVRKLVSIRVVKLVYRRPRIFRYARVCGITGDSSLFREMVPVELRGPIERDLLGLGHDEEDG